MPDPTLEAVLAEVESLRGALKEATGTLQIAIDQANKRGKRQWKWIVFDISLSVIVIFGGFVVAHDSHKTDQNSAAIVQSREALKATCTSGNIVRAKDIKIWDTAIELIAPPARLNASGLKSEEGFKNYVAHTFAPRDCNAIK